VQVRGRPLAVVLLSGGLDSATAAACAKRDGYDVLALSVRYGQRHAKELRSARNVAGALRAREHKVVRVPLGEFAGSALTDRRLKVPRGRKVKSMSRGIPLTYVPARNTVFLALAAAFAESRGARAIYIGANAIDYSGYPDCRPEFLRAFERALARGTKAGVEGRPIRIRAPLIRKTKAEIVRLALRLHVPVELTWSCYLGGRVACGTCDSCLLRLKGFREAGATDPVPYAARGRRAPRRPSRAHA
jgi:7-cyano-7-deazaguanine synthase